MTKVMHGFTLLVSLATVGQQLAAAPMLSLQSTRADLERLVVGETVTFNVTLSQLGNGVELDSLAATVKYNGELLSTPSIGAGEIIPPMLHDPLDFVSSGDVGIADAAFVTLGTQVEHHIRDNGTFFTFDLTAMEVGSGVMTFDFVGATRFNTVAPIVVDVEAGPEINFTVVPEPTSEVAFVTGMVLLAFMAHSYSHRRHEQRR